jgi:hypothetical protein
VKQRLWVIDPSSNKTGELHRWVVDAAGNIAISRAGLRLIVRIERLHVPAFTSTEEATDWGSHLNREQHATLVDIQRTSSNAALAERDLEKMVNLATRSQLIREAAEASDFEFVEVSRRDAGGAVTATT